jgi:glycosyltransferase involved in cell wall biosynthesis
VGRGQRVHLRHRRRAQFSECCWSRLDGRPVVVLEALALGVTVIASRVGALPELIEDGVNGVLCDAGDIDGFVACLVGLASTGTVWRE